MLWNRFLFKIISINNIHVLFLIIVAEINGLVDKY